MLMMLCRSCQADRQYESARMPCPRGGHCGSGLQQKRERESVVSQNGYYSAHIPGAAAWTLHSFTASIICPRDVKQDPGSTSVI